MILIKCRDRDYVMLTCKALDVFNLCWMYLMLMMSLFVLLMGIVGKQSPSAPADLLSHSYSAKCVYVCVWLVHSQFVPVECVCAFLSRNAETVLLFLCVNRSYRRLLFLQTVCLSVCFS